MCYIIVFVGFTIMVLEYTWLKILTLMNLIPVSMNLGLSIPRTTISHSR